MAIASFLIASCLLVFLGFITFRIIVRRDYQKKGKLGWFATTCEFIIFALHANFPYLFLPTKWPDIPKLPDNRIQFFSGLLLFILGFILTLWSMGYLGFIKACGQKTDGLKASGIYAFTRNPQIIFYGLMLLGIAVLWISWYTVGWLCIYLVIAHLMVITEEEHLKAVYGDSYMDYWKRVPRYFLNI